MAKDAIARTNNGATAGIVDGTERTQVTNKQRYALVSTVSEWYARGSAQQPCKFFVGGGLADERDRERRQASKKRNSY